MVIQAVGMVAMDGLTLQYTHQGQAFSRSKVSTDEMNLVSLIQLSSLADYSDLYT